MAVKFILYIMTEMMDGQAQAFLLEVLYWEGS